MYFVYVLCWKKVTTTTTITTIITTTCNAKHLSMFVEKVII